MLSVAIGMALFTAGRAQEPPATEFPFRFESGLIWVQVTTPGRRQPLNFLLDSGAAVSVINLRTARRLGLAPGSAVQVRGVEASAKGYWPQRLTARAGMVALPDEYLALDLAAFSRACDRSVDGLIGADFFRGRIVQIDFDAKKIRLLKRLKAGPATDSLPLAVCPSALRVPLRINSGPPSWMRLDTGCASPLQWVTSPVPAQHCGRRLAVGLSRVAFPETKTNVQFGRAQIKDVPTGLHQREIFPGEAGLLGTGLLCRFRVVTIDAVEGRLVLSGPR